MSDPGVHVTLFHMETQQAVPANYDSKRGFLGNFTPGTYECQALVNGEEHMSEEYIVHGWIGKDERVCIFKIFLYNFKKKKKKMYHLDKGSNIKCMLV